MKQTEEKAAHVLAKIDECYKQLHLNVHPNDVTDLLSLIQIHFLEKFPDDQPARELKQGVVLLESLATLHAICSNR